METPDEACASSLRQDHGSVSSQKQGKFLYTYGQGLENWIRRLFGKLGISDVKELQRDTDLKSDDIIFGFQWGKSRDLIDMKCFSSELDGIDPAFKDVNRIFLICFMEDNRENHSDSCYFKETSRQKNISFHEIHCNANNEIIECARYHMFKKYVQEMGILLQNTFADCVDLIEYVRQFEGALEHRLSAKDSKQPLQCENKSVPGDFVTPENASVPARKKNTDPELDEKMMLNKAKKFRSYLERWHNMVTKHQS